MKVIYIASINKHYILLCFYGILVYTFLSHTGNPSWYFRKYYSHSCSAILMFFVVFFSHALIYN